MARLSMLFVSLAFLSVVTRAQSPGAREYLNIPVNEGLFYMDFVGSTSESSGPDLALPNNVSVSRFITPTVLWSFPLQGQYAGLSLTVPISTVRSTSPGGRVETTGFNDPAIAFHKNIFGLKALDRAHISEYKPKTLMSFHFTVNPPIGSYDSSEPANTGANRWAFTPLINLNIPLNNGVSWIEIYTWGRFYTDNNKFRGTSLLTQHPLGITSLYYSHNLGKKMWASIGVYYDYGGETFINHVPQHDSASAFRPSVGINRRFGSFAVTVRYENSASKPNAAPNSGLIMVRVGVPPFHF